MQVNNEPDSQQNSGQETVAEIETISPLIRCYGVVAILDALGSRGMSYEDALDFVASRDSLARLFRETENEMIQWVTGTDDSGTARLFPLKEKCIASLALFGDTILVSWSIREKAMADLLLAIVGEALRDFLVQALAKHQLFRGAFSLGEFYTDQNNTILGPAVADAAWWYDKTKQIGIVASPQTGLRLDSICETDVWKAEKFQYDLSYIKQNVPLGAIGTRKLWTINWPFGLLKEEQAIKEQTSLSVKRYLLHVLGNAGVPYGSEDKHLNTLDFFDTCRVLWNVRQGKDPLSV